MVGGIPTGLTTVQQQQRATHGELVSNVLRVWQHDGEGGGGGGRRRRQCSEMYGQASLHPLTNDVRWGGRLHAQCIRDAHGDGAAVHNTTQEGGRMPRVWRRGDSLGADGSMQGARSVCVPPACAMCSCNWLASGPVTRLKGAVVGGTMSWPVLPTVSVGFGPDFVTLAAPGHDVVHCGTAGPATRVISKGMGVDGMPASHGRVWRSPPGGPGAWLVCWQPAVGGRMLGSPGRHRGAGCTLCLCCST